MEDLRRRVERNHQGAPQRLQLARLQLDTIEQAMKVLQGLGERIVFGFLPPPPPIEYPKMMYKDVQPQALLEATVHNENEEQKFREKGYFLMEAVAPHLEPEEPEEERPTPETITVQLRPRIDTNAADNQAPQPSQQQG
jgi:hypothetical protein